MGKELQEFYGWAARAPIFTVGAPQYDVFFRDEFRQSRQAFFRQYDLEPDRPLILYCLGSPNIIREDYGALQFVERASVTPELAGAQVIVRPHPGFYEHGYSELDELRRRFPRVVVQTPHRHWNRVPFQSAESVVEWVNSVRHADVVVNLASTMTVDAAVVDRPVVNLDFDPQPGSPNQLYVKEINHRWNHFSPVAESGGVWLVNNMDELTTAVTVYLKTPELHREQRKWIVKHVCGQADGHSGKRMAEAVAQVARGRGTSKSC
jgi:hypothetical protein